MIARRKTALFVLRALTVTITLAIALLASSAAADTRRQGSVRTVPYTRVYALGDSVMLGARPQLERQGITVNAVESRQFIQGISILNWMRASGTLPGEVVVDLGTNGPMSGASFDAMMRVLRSVPRVIFVTVKEPRWWEADVNDVLRAGVARWPTARLADWHAVAVWHPNWFWSDGIHLTPAGAIAYARLIAHALAAR